MCKNKFFSLKILPHIILLAFPSTLSGAIINVEGNNFHAIEIKPQPSSGLDGIYLVENTSDVKISYKFKSPKSIKWFSFSKNGAYFSKEIDFFEDGGISTVQALPGSCGYIVEDGSKRYYFWIIDYSEFQFIVNSIEPTPQQTCDATSLDIDCTEIPVSYYTVSGKQETLPRNVEMTYNTLVWDESILSYKQALVTKTIANISHLYNLIPAVLCNTSFSISSDMYQREWGNKQKVESSTFSPNAVEVMTTATQYTTHEASEGVSNILSDTSNEENYGGSAPVLISFKSYTTDAILHYEWQFSKDEEFSEITDRFYAQDLDYNFTEAGTIFVRFIGSNHDGSCEAYGETYKISVGTSELKIPNTFSPNSDGINDEWKIAYRSLVEFHCSIFNRNGHEIFSFEDPAQGWDGKHNGKLVNPGVYFYVIKAVGADGKIYKKSGDINILKYSNSDNSSDK